MRGQAFLVWMPWLISNGKSPLAIKSCRLMSSKHWWPKQDVVPFCDGCMTNGLNWTLRSWLMPPLDWPRPGRDKAPFSKPCEWLGKVKRAASRSPALRLRVGSLNSWILVRPTTPKLSSQIPFKVNFAPTSSVVCLGWRSSTDLGSEVVWPTTWVWARPFSCWRFSCTNEKVGRNLDRRSWSFQRPWSPTGSGKPSGSLPICAFQFTMAWSAPVVTRSIAWLSPAILW